MVLPEIKELENVGMPYLKVDRECTGSLVAPLINVTSSSIICTQHWHNAIRVAVSNRNIGARKILVRAITNLCLRVPCSPNTMDVQTDPASSFADHGALFEYIQGSKS